MSALFIVFFALTVAGMILWFRHKQICAEIRAKSKITFYHQARKMLRDSDLNSDQKEKIYKWADTLESRRYAWCFFKTLGEVCSSIKKGKRLQIDKKQKEDYTEDMVKLFTHWMTAQAYALPVMSWYMPVCISYISSDDREKVPAQIEVNRDVFKDDMCMMAA